MSRTNKIILGALTLWPIAYGFIFVGSIALQFGFVASGLKIVLPFALIILLHFLTMGLSVLLIGYYIYHVFQRDDIDQDRKLLWSLFLFVGNMIAMPIYWYLHVWQRDETYGIDSMEDSALEREEGRDGEL